MVLTPGVPVPRLPNRIVVVGQRLASALTVLKLATLWLHALVQPEFARLGVLSSPPLATLFSPPGTPRLVILPLGTLLFSLPSRALTLGPGLPFPFPSRVLPCQDV